MKEFNVKRVVNPVSNRDSIVETVIATSEHSTYAHIIADSMQNKFGSKYCNFYVSQD